MTACHFLLVVNAGHLHWGKTRVSLKPSVGGRTRKSNCDKGGNNGPVEPSDAGSRDELASLEGALLVPDVKCKLVLMTNPARTVRT